MLTHTKHDLLHSLPFSYRVPWEELFVWIDTHTYLDTPIEAIRNAMQGIDIPRQLTRMQEYRRELIWAENGSRVLQNVLLAAVSKMR